MDDQFGWLEDVEDATALDWVRARNAEAEAALFVDPLFESLRESSLAILEADDRIAYPTVHGDEVLNFWTDATHRRGIWRRTTWASYQSADPEWETILDVDALSQAEGESWVMRGIAVRKPDRGRALITLAPGGSDTSVTREFDIASKSFVLPEDGGFVRALSKGSMSWVDEDTVYLDTDMGEGSMTRSGYPRQVREWRRGTDPLDAPVVFEGEVDDVMVAAAVSTRPGYPHHVMLRRVTFFTDRYYLRRDGELHLFDVPDDAQVRLVDEWATATLRTDWTVGNETFTAGSLIVTDLELLLAGRPAFTALFTPTETTSLAGWTTTRNHLVLNILDDVKNRLELRTPTPTGWVSQPLAGAPEVWIVAAGPVDSDASDELWISGEDFLTPPTLYRGDERASVAIRSTPASFDAAGLAITQRFVASVDGTRIPYFIVSPADADGGPRPTLLGGYGGFEIPRLPNYSGLLGDSWLAAGGSYVLANIRGGGEYGPRWHQAGLRENRHLVYEDFESVARDLIERGDTTAAQLGCSGGSNGGLLVGNMYVRSPELFGAIVCQVPLLDMYRYTHLLAGASWAAEYGDPDVPEDWEFIKTFSPYHLIDAATDYPPLLLTTSTRDDRVHPGHARKMAAKLLSLGKDVTYWENIEGGHGGAADAPQQATMSALTYTFLRRHLMGAR